MPTRLRRTVRFALQPGARRSVNGFAGSPPLVGLSPYAQCTVECVGEPDPTSGYLINIKAIDEAVHEAVRPRLESVLAEAASDSPPSPAQIGAALRDAFAELDAHLPVASRAIELALSPYHVLSMTSDAPNTASVRLRFDFAAAHRLHVPEWDDQANREYFGKCCNPNGHGHNYGLEVRVLAPTPRLDTLSAHRLERLVDETVIERFDHKHLNLDTAEFADEGGVIPTVENIARVCYELLTEPVASLGHGVSLASVTVWETDRTSAEYPG